MRESAATHSGQGPYRFGVFQFDPVTLELRKHGRAVRIRPQPLKLLGVLLARPGELVTREEIQQALWGTETFVDYEQGVNHTVQELRAALGDASSSPRFIETLPRRGYRFIAPTEKPAAALVAVTVASAVPADPPPALVSPLPAAQDSTAPRWSRPGLLTSGVGLALVVVALGAIGWTSKVWSGARTTLSAPAMLTVRSFSTEGVDATLGAGLSNAILARLGGQGRVIVRSASGQGGRAGAQGEVDSTGGMLLDGAIDKAGETVSVVIRLQDAATGRPLWSDRFQVRAQELFSIENVVAERIIDAFDLRLAAAEQERLRRPYTRNGAAYEDYLRGRADLIRYTPDGTLRAVEAFEAALQKDSSFALARAGLAMACADMCLRFAPASDVERWGQRAEQEARAALEIDPSLAEAHLARAATARKREFDWPAVMAASDRALVLNPNLPQARFFRAAALYHLGYMDESLIEVEKGRKLRGPDVVEPVRTEGLVALFSGNFAPARVHLEDVSRLSSQPIGDTYLALAYYYSGSSEKALSMLESLAGHSSASTATRASAILAGMLAAGGDVARARRYVDAVLAHTYRDHHVAYSLGVAYTQLGSVEEARRWLRTAVDTGFLSLVWYQRDPLLEPLRQRPEFGPLLAYVRERRDSSASTIGR